jgi:hypothetical protein
MREAPLELCVAAGAETRPAPVAVTTTAKGGGDLPCVEFVATGEERPDVEVLDPGAAVDQVLGDAFSEADTKQPVAVCGPNRARLVQALPLDLLELEQPLKIAVSQLRPRPFRDVGAGAGPRQGCPAGSRAPRR